jgi:hypoxanthine phosphoribosyltransferase
MDDIYIKYICFIFICIAHLGILNKLEKSFIKILFEDNDTIKKFINRPLDYCKDSFDFNIYCIGIPSGHTEVATIISILLTHYNFIPLSVAILLIFGIALQRIIKKMHTIEQIIVGLIFGVLYSLIYIKTDTSLKSILLISGIIIGLSLILTLYVDNKIQNDKIPEWVDKKMYSIIEKKKNVPFYLKYGTILTGLYYEDLPLYIDYKTLEIYLDKCINKIEDSKIKFDAIVGIKSGGAIISNYIAKKLKINNYSIKFTKKINECNEEKLKYSDSIIDNLLSKRKENKLCEGIDDILENKNIILIDEQVETGSTMESAINYLINEKKVTKLFLITITSTHGSVLLNNIQLNYIKNYKYSMIYPWGYDN